MVEENAYIKKVQIGEKEVVNGSAIVPVQVDSGVINGEYVLYAEYSGDENYAPSSATGTVRIGYHSMVHVPRLYVWDEFRSSTPLLAHIYMGCYQAGQGTGTFAIDGAYIDTASPTKVGSGKALKYWDTTYLDRTDYKGHKLMFKYNGYTTDLQHMINPGMSNENNIYILSIENNTALWDEDTDFERGFPRIDIDPVAGKPGETVTTKAHVYLIMYGNVINIKDIASDYTGKLTFGYEGMKEGQFWDASGFEDGYATITFTLPDWDDGGYDLYAFFKHKSGQKWASTYGATSMFITHYTPMINEPTLTVQDISFDKGTESAYITGQFYAPVGEYQTLENVQLAGYASLLIDGTAITLTNSNLTSGTVPVSDSGRVEFQFSIPVYVDTTSPAWCKPGKHYITILYHQTSTDSDYEYNPDARLIIRRETELTIDNIDDNDGLIYLPNNGDTTSIRCIVDDIDDGTIINEGSVLVSYEKTDTMED